MNPSRSAFLEIVYFHFQTVFEYFMLLFVLDIMHPNVFLKPIVSMDVKHVDLKKVDVGNQF